MFNNVIHNAIIKYKSENITPDQIDNNENFDMHEKEVLNIIFEPTFNECWIYLSDELILNQLTDEKHPMALNNFYERFLLSSDYIDGIDYKQIDSNSDLVKMSNYISAKYQSNCNNFNYLKTHYVITGSTYKDLLHLY